jgi:uncharacterized protein (TIGR01244 family)
MTADLNNLPIPNAMLAGRGVVSAGQPDLAGLASARAAGIRHVINLRPATEDPSFDTAAAVHSLGLGYAALPIAGAADFSREKVAAFDALLREAGDGPVLVHCASGNRVGALMALRARWLEGASVEQAMEVGARAGLTKLAGTVRGLLET